MESYSKVMRLDGEFFSVKSKDYNEKTLNCVIEAVKKLDGIDIRKNTKW